MDQEEITTGDIVENGVHTYSSVDTYVPPEDPEVIRQLEWFQDQKLALMMHWGPYSQLGLVESWALSDQDADWSRIGIDWGISGEELKRQYRALNKTFNPVRFQPEKMAELAAESGFKYLIFTTKHHDGFCMWDTKYSDYRTTAPDCPFHTHRNADICAHIFEAFRKEGLGVAAYFSKADWHTPAYWAPNTERGNFMWRGPSYIPAENPELWEQFVQFTHNQVLELVENYGRIDALWFDAGWVCRQSGQDIRIEELINKARKIQPWVLSADRTCGGPCENYVTPEQCVPSKPLGVPWESCVTMGTSFSFKYEDTYKSVKELIHMLVDIVAKGGNLALNVGPQPDGRLPEPAIIRMRGMGRWLKVYGDAIYGTRVCPPYRADDFAFTRKGEAVYAIHLPNKTVAQGSLQIPYTKKISRVIQLSSGKQLDFKQDNKGILFAVPPYQSEIAEVYTLLE